jgi:hypothetical protein
MTPLVLRGAHFFELSGASPLVQAVGDALEKGYEANQPLPSSLFLPAPKTWIEWGGPQGRLACVLEGLKGSDKSSCP